MKMNKNYFLKTQNVTSIVFKFKLDKSILVLVLVRVGEKKLLLLFIIIIFYKINFSE